MEDLNQLSKAELISIIRQERAEKAELRAEVSALRALVVDLQSTVKSLQEELSKYKTPKNSHNSSKPPSSDYGVKGNVKKNQSLRKQGKKPRGGQPGHKDDTLHRVDVADKIENHTPLFCQDCGADLSGIDEVLESSRQVVDLPLVKPVYTEHRSYSRRCQCGHKNVGSFPVGVNSSIQYGSSVTALVSYLSVRQYIPMNRIKELLSDVLDLRISEGGIEGLIARFAQKATPVYEQIKSRIIRSGVAGADETGAKVAGRKGWFWTWQNDLLTYIVSSDNRGFQTVEQHFPQGLAGLVLVSDCWSAHLKTKAKTHQLCLAHLLRDLNYVIDLDKSAAWAKKVKKLFLEAMAFKHQLTKEDFPLSQPKTQQIKQFEQRLDQLLKSKRPAKHTQAIKLQKRLNKNREYIFPFLYYHYVPPDNNGSERAIRNVKVKMKVSGQFRSQKGANQFAIIRSVIDTCIKTGTKVIEAMNLIPLIA